MSDEVGEFVLTRFMDAWKMLMKHLIIRTNPAILLENKNAEYTQLLDPLEAICLCRNQCTIVEALMNACAYVVCNRVDRYVSGVGNGVDRAALGDFATREQYIMIIKTNRESQGGHDSVIFSISGHHYVFESLRSGFLPSIYPVGYKDVIARIALVGGAGDVMKIYPFDYQEIIATIDLVTEHLYIPEIGEIGENDYYGDKHIEDTNWRDGFVEEAFHILDNFQTIALLNSAEEAEARLILPEELDNRFLIYLSGAKIRYSQIKPYSEYDNDDLFG